MNCDELREHYDLYALDIAEAPESGEIRAHIRRGCEVCIGGREAISRNCGVHRRQRTAGGAIGAASPPYSGFGGVRGAEGRLDTLVGFGACG